MHLKISAIGSAISEEIQDNLLGSQSDQPCAVRRYSFSIKQSLGNLLPSFTRRLLVVGILSYGQ
jgi:hypothetical protein